MPADPLWRQPAAPVPPADAVAVVHAFLHLARMVTKAERALAEAGGWLGEKLGAAQSR